MLPPQTVRVKTSKTPMGFMIINRSDFIQGHHEEYEGPEVVEDMGEKFGLSAEEIPLVALLVANSMARKLGIPVQQWNEMEPEDRLANLRLAVDDMNEALGQFGEDFSDGPGQGGALFKAKHVGRGKWKVVDESDRDVASGFDSKDAAEAYIAEVSKNT